VGKRGKPAEPQEGGEPREKVGPARRPYLERLQHHPDILAVVVGNGRPVGCDEARSRLVDRDCGGVPRRSVRIKVAEGAAREIVGLDVGQLGFDPRLASLGALFGIILRDGSLLEAERLLDGRQRSFCRVLHLFLLDRHDPPSMTQLLNG
jgi:hypothetical protein